MTLPEGRRAGASMTYTSGTTGRPKGVRRPLAPVAPEVVAEPNAMFLGLFGIRPKDNGVHLVVAPLYHTAVLNFCTNHMHFGHTVVLMDKWTPEETLAEDRPLSRHDEPHGSHAFPAALVVAGRGARRAPTCRRSGT